MVEAFSGGLLLPAVVLGLLAWAVPRLLSLVIPEGVGPLMLIAFLSAISLYALSGLFFMGLYMWQGIPWDRITEPGWAANVVFFGRRGLTAGIIWVPIMVLSVAGLPRTWKKVVW